MATTYCERVFVFKSVAAALVLTLIFVWIGWQVVHWASLFETWTVWQGAMLAILLASLPMAIGIAGTARMRLFVTNIDGSRPQPGTFLDLLLRYNTNTIEQFVLFVVACAGFACFAGDNAARILPVMGCWFIVARVLFFAGYIHEPLWRAFGFAATFVPTLTLILLSIWFALS